MESSSSLISGVGTSTAITSNTASSTANGTYTTINDPHGTNGTESLGINDYGKIVGIYWDSNHFGHGFHT
jgi:hypothetical protein